MNKEQINKIAIALGGAIVGSISTALFIRWKFKQDLEFLGIANAMTEQGIRTLERLQGDWDGD